MENRTGLEFWFTPPDSKQKQVKRAWRAFASGHPLTTSRRAGDSRDLDPGTILPAIAQRCPRRFLHFIKLMPTSMRQTVRFPPVACFRGASATARRT